MRGYETGQVRRRGDSVPYIEFWEQSFLLWLIFKVYQVWESCSFHLMTLLSKWHRRFFYNGEDYVPLLARQDQRCDRLRHKKRIRLAIVYATQEQYDAINGEAVASQQPRHEIQEPVSLELAPSTQE